MFQSGFGLLIKKKKKLKHKDNSLKQLTTANANGPWTYIWEDFLSEGFLRLRFGGFIFGRDYFWRGLLSEFDGIHPVQK